MYFLSSQSLIYMGIQKRFQKGIQKGIHEDKTVISLIITVVLFSFLIFFGLGGVKRNCPSIFGIAANLPYSI